MIRNANVDRSTREHRRRISSLNVRKKEGNVPKVSTARSSGGKPKLGQHFLTDPMAPGRIADALGDITRSTVLEIGPGRGVLTSLLAKRARRLIAIETDRVLAAQLRMKFSLYGNVEIIEGDILAVDFDTIFGPKPGSTRPGISQQPERVRVVGNLPFFITSDILLRLFAFRKYFETSVLMVQREVADRLAAPPGSSEYGLLSATTQLYTTVEKLFTLPPTAFTPPPKVHSTVVRLTMTVSPGKLARAGDCVYRLPQAVVWAKAKDSLEQSQVAIRQQDFAGGDGASGSEVRCPQ